MFEVGDKVRYGYACIPCNNGEHPVCWDRRIHDGDYCDCKKYRHMLFSEAELVKVA